MDGLEEGLGVALGLLDGEVLGELLGLGVALGLDDGEVLGDDDGDELGDGLGLLDGLGVALGLDEGEVDGEVDGDEDGDVEGDDDARNGYVNPFPLLYNALTSDCVSSRFQTPNSSIRPSK